MENDKNKFKGQPDPQTGTPKDAPDTPHAIPPVTPVENALGVPSTPVDEPQPADGFPPVTGDPQYDEPPAKEAIEEKNDRPAANLIIWAILIAVVIMAIIYFFVFYDRDPVSSAP